LFFEVEIIGKRPELGHDQEIENSDPEKKGDAQRNLQLTKQIEKDEI